MKKFTFIGVGLALILSVAYAAEPTFFRNLLISESVKVGGTGLANSKAALELNSTTKGFLLSRMTEAQRDAISSPPEALALYNSTNKKINIYDGTTWNEVGGASANPLNLLIGNNYNFETGVGSWSASGGTVTHETTSELVGSGSLKHAATGAGQTAVINSISIPASFVGNLCMIAIPTYIATIAYEITLFDSFTSTNIVNDVLLETTEKSEVISFICPTGPVNLQIIAGGGTGAIIIDEVFLGVQWLSTWGWSADKIKTFTAKLNCDGSSVIQSQLFTQTAPLPAVSSISNIAGNGSCTVTLATGFFSVAPSCLVTFNSNFTTTGFMLGAEATSATTVVIDCESDASAVCTSFDSVLRCEGR